MKGRWKPGSRLTRLIAEFLYVTSATVITRKVLRRVLSQGRSLAHKVRSSLISLPFT
jgi:hypothetical protein